MDKKVSSLNDFVQRHNLVASKAIENESSAIYWIRQAYLGISSAKFKQDVTSDEMVVLKLMLFKLIQHTEGSIVTFVTGSKSSACTISRTASELAMSIMYILEEDLQTRLIQYFLTQLKDERNRLNIFAKSEARKKADPSHFPGQTNVIELLEQWCKNWATRMGVVNIDKNWPDMARVFEKSGHEFQYRTAYSVMSGKTHGQALDFLQILAFGDIAFTSNDGSIMSAIIDSLVLTERMILYSGILYTLEATYRYASHFQLNENIIEPLNTGKEVISAILSEMAIQHSQITEVLRD